MWQENRGRRMTKQELYENKQIAYKIMQIMEYYIINDGSKEDIAKMFNDIVEQEYDNLKKFYKERTE